MAPAEVKSLRIICAEDDRFFREAVVAILASTGHRVQAAADGKLAWEILSTEKGMVDVLVTDHQMPGFTGLELVQLLRQTAFPGRIYVYSSQLKPAAEAAYRALRVDGIFAKSTSPEELLRVVGLP